MIKEEGVLPNLLVIGGQKCGSTWIHYKLNNHVDCFMSKTKEVGFFLKNIDDQNLVDYKEHFKIDSQKYTYYGESTPVYFWTYDKAAKYCQYNFGNKHIPSTIHRSLGSKLRIVLSLRNPVDRAVSAYFHHFKNGRFRGNESILDVGNQFGIIDMGFYKRHLKHWYKYYSKENFTTVFFDDIKSKPKETLIAMFKDLKISHEIDYLDGISKQNNPGFVLKASNNCLTIDMESSEKLNKSTFQNNVDKLHKNYVIPLIHKNELIQLQNIFKADSDYIMTHFNRLDLNWNSPIELNSFLNN